MIQCLHCGKTMDEGKVKDLIDDHWHYGICSSCKKIEEDELSERKKRIKQTKNVGPDDITCPGSGCNMRKKKSSKPKRKVCKCKK